jgi:hypothetical protein
VAAGPAGAPRGDDHLEAGERVDADLRGHAPI